MNIFRTSPCLSFSVLKVETGLSIAVTADKSIYADDQLCTADSSWYNNKTAKLKKETKKDDI